MNNENKEMVEQFRICAGITSADQEVQEKVLISECLELITAYAEGDELGFIDGAGGMLFCEKLTDSITHPDGFNHIADKMNAFGFGLFLDNKKAFKNRDQIVKAVCISNLSKFDKTEFEAIKTKEKYLKIGIATRYELINKLYVARAIGGDHADYPKDMVLKSLAHYKKPDFDFYFKE